MDTNIIVAYKAFIKREYYEFYHLILDDKYQKKLITPFINKYIEVRYYNETNYPREKDIVKRISKELNIVYQNALDNNEDLLKNIHALFGYILYFDDVIILDDNTKLFDILYEDNTITLPKTEEIKNKLILWYKEFLMHKNSFFKVLDNNEFYIEEKRVSSGLYLLNIKSNVKVSYLYSDLAIIKAQESSIVKEDMLSVLLIKTSLMVLNNAIGLDFSRRYIIDYPNTLWEKKKKNNRMLSLIDNTLAKKYIELRISYTDYLNNIDEINELIHAGYTFSLILDDKFEGDTSKFVLFSTLFINHNNEYYDNIYNSKDEINNKIVLL